MGWIIIKSWRGLPLLTRRITQQVFETQPEAKKKAKELEKCFPGRVFHIAKTTLTPTDNTSNGWSD